jgi:hypothetical protein
MPASVPPIKSQQNPRLHRLALFDAPKASLGVTELQKKAPYALKLLDGSIKAPLAFPHSNVVANPPLQRLFR